MNKFKAFRLNLTSKPIKYRITLLCKIFVIGLLLQFFLQTFVTFQLGWNGKFWNLVRLWKEFILLIFAVTILRYSFSHLKEWTSSIKNKNNSDKISLSMIWKEIQPKFFTQFILLFLLNLIIFFVLAIFIQKVGISAFLLTVKYDLIGFFILGIGLSLAYLFFTEEDKNIIELYQKLIIRCLIGGLIRRFIVRLMPNVLKYIGHDPFSFEGSIGNKPPTAYYTLINTGHVRNQFLFERPTSFGFRLISFFPIFVLGYLKKKNWKDQLVYTIIFGLLILSTRSRAGIAVRIVEAIILFFILYWKSVKKYFIRLCILFLIMIGGIAYLGRGIMVREHSNTGHLVLMKAGLNLATNNLITGWGAGYAGPASHIICYTENPVDIYADIDSIHLENSRCDTIRKINITNQISTYGFNPENQYLQILIEYGIVGLLFRGALCLLILFYTGKMIYLYHNKNKSPYQELLYYTLLGFGIGFIGLCAEGLVLHSLADRMIVYPFFLLYGITIGLREKEKDKTYIALSKKKHKKKTKFHHKSKEN